MSTVEDTRSTDLSTTPEVALRPPRASLSASSVDFGISAIIVMGVALVFAATTPALRHWMLLPVSLCGVIAGVDAVRVFRRRLDVVDPQALLSFFAVHFFFLAPMLHVRWDHWPKYILQQPTDWRPWLGRMAWLNLLGLIAFRLVLAIVDRTKARRAERPSRVYTSERFWPAWMVLVLLCLMAQIWLVLLADGVSGFVSRSLVSGEGFVGLGWVLVISESLPLLVLFGVVYRLRGKRLTVSLPVVCTMLVGFGLLRLALGGLRGSRGNTVWALLFAVCLIHLLLRRVPARIIVTGALVGFLFMYVYGFYKSVGAEGTLRALTSSSERAELEETTGRSLDTLILSDLGRADIQALELERRETGRFPFEPRLGATYLGGALLNVPSETVQQAVPDKRQAGTDLFYGQTLPRGYLIVHIYGLAGEWMLNFPPETVPLAFVIFGFLVARVLLFVRSLARDDMRVALIPLASILFILGLSSDLDNVVHGLIAFGLLPIVLIYVGSTRARAARPATSA